MNHINDRNLFNNKLTLYFTNNFGIENLYVYIYISIFGTSWIFSSDLKKTDDPIYNAG